MKLSYDFFLCAHSSAILSNVFAENVAPTYYCVLQLRADVEKSF